MVETLEPGDKDYIDNGIDEASRYANEGGEYGRGYEIVDVGNRVLGGTGLRGVKTDFVMPQQPVNRRIFPGGWS